MAIWILELQVINSLQKIEDMLAVIEPLEIDLYTYQSRLFGASLTVPNWIIGA